LQHSIGLLEVGFPSFGKSLFFAFNCQKEASTIILNTSILLFNILNLCLGFLVLGQKLIMLFSLKADFVCVRIRGG
jgi:hypothetical protein